MIFSKNGKHLNMKDEKLTPEEELRADNQIEALKFNMKFGGEMHISSDAPPEVIKEWLEAVNERESAFQNAEKIPIYDFIGKPDFVPFEDIKDDELEAALKGIEDLLEAKFIAITQPEFMKAKGWYKFLIKDLFKHLITNYSAPGMIHTFDYNDFHHDGPDFIAEHAQAVIEDIIDLKKPYEALWLSDTCRNQHDVISKEQAIETVLAFRAKYKEIIPVGFSAVRLQPEPSAMYFMFGIEWEGMLARSDEKETFEGMGVCQMNLENGEWMVEGVMMPGFEF